MKEPRRGWRTDGAGQWGPGKFLRRRCPAMKQHSFSGAVAFTMFWRPRRQTRRGGGRGRAPGRAGSGARRRERDDERGFGFRPLAMESWIMRLLQISDTPVPVDRQALPARLQSAGFTRSPNRCHTRCMVRSSSWKNMLPRMRTNCQPKRSSTD
jgi:hypothetical protein